MADDLSSGYAMPLKCSGSHPLLQPTALGLRFCAVVALEAKPCPPSEAETLSELDHTVGLAI
jgi:hypothetical protein